MYDQDYEEILIEYGDKEEIPYQRLERILDQLDDLVEIEMRKERVSAILLRLSQGGSYKHISYERHNEVYILIGRDDTPTVLSPDALDLLFSPSYERPQPPATSPAS